MSSYWTILDSVRTVLGSLPGLAGSQIRIRKRPFFSNDHGDVYPMLCLSGTREEIAEEMFEKQLLVDYPVVVVLFQKEGATLQKESEYQYQLDRREEIRRALHKTTLSGASGVMDSNYEAGSVFDVAALEKMHDTSVQVFRFRNNEVRE